MSFFKNLFSDNNDINEKSIIGFISFGMMVIALIIDLITGALGKELLINEFIFDGFMIITLGAFGIASVDKWTNRKTEIEKEKIEAEAENDEPIL
jgi:hypothetical protein